MIPEASAILGIAIVAFGMALTPGPNMIYLVSRTLSQGTLAGFVSLCGTALGFAIYMTAANLGLAVVFAVVPWLYTIIKVAGALYLLYLAWTVLRGSARLFEPTQIPRDSKRRLFGMGLATNLLNPKAVILYAALIPQFIDPARGNVVAQGFVLGGVQIVASIVVNSAFILSAGSIALLVRRRPRWAVWQRRVVGGALAGIGVHLLLDSHAPVSAGAAS
ncbi:LysE family translocator [Microbacterium keratanolyticum]|uniref:LysE family translocator n=1 Tax=Microbacterium keratanolyticum TaxID=67574 RepID=UPI00363E7EC3